uniref:Uncharacterized protein n=1 Tax=Steinernema glaseri TaxID=37863 RepID=A0A1I8AB94_9BILA
MSWLYYFGFFVVWLCSAKKHEQAQERIVTLRTQVNTSRADVAMTSGQSRAFVPERTFRVESTTRCASLACFPFCHFETKKEGAGPALRRVAEEQRLPPLAGANTTFRIRRIDHASPRPFLSTDAPSSPSRGVREMNSLRTGMPRSAFALLMLLVALRLSQAEESVEISLEHEEERERERRGFGSKDFVLPENFRTLRRKDIPVTYRLHDDLLRFYRKVRPKGM